MVVFDPKSLEVKKRLPVGLAKIPTGLAYDPKTKKILLSAAEYQETPTTDPSKRPRRSVKPGSFIVLVVGES